MATVKIEVENKSVHPEQQQQQTIQNTEVPALAEEGNALPNFSADVQDEIKQLSANSVRVDFVNACVDVPIKGGTKRILNNVSGYNSPGEILYIMGPSGSGKTTLLDFLCNRTKTSPENSVYLNKKKWTEGEFRKIARYCQQHPQLYEVLTVQETLDIAASFFTKTAHDRKQRVNAVITMLGLEEQRTTKIGGLFFRGISGGQKQRVSVGEQLVANPKVLFLDEPTSGLDSAAAYQLMVNLREICKTTRISIISSIHQPSQRVFEMSDNLIILSGGKGIGGNTAYFGKTKNLGAHFREIGIKNDTTASDSEWILDEVNGDYGNVENIKKIVQQYQTSSTFKNIQEKQGFVQKSQEMEVYKYTGEDTKSGFFKDMLTLFQRGMKNNLKNPLAQGIRIVTYCMMSFVLGSVWFGSGDEPKAGDIQNISGVLFFMAAFFAMMSISVLPVNLEDRMIMVKERSNGAYNLIAYSVSNMIVNMPFTFILSLTAASITFFMVQFENEDGGPYILFILNTFVTILAAEGLILIISYVFSHLLICIVVTSMIMGTFMVMNGFFIKKSDIPDYWIWVYYLAFNSYSFQNFMHGAYNDITIGADPNNTPPAPFDYPGKLVLKDLDMDDTKVGVNIIVVIAFALGYRLIAHFYSYFKHTGKK